MRVLRYNISHSGTIPQPMAFQIMVWTFRGAMQFTAALKTAQFLAQHLHAKGRQVTRTSSGADPHNFWVPVKQATIPRQQQRLCKRSATANKLQLGERAALKFHKAAHSSQELKDSPDPSLAVDVQTLKPRNTATAHTTTGDSITANAVPVTDETGSIGKIDNIRLQTEQKQWTTSTNGLTNGDGSTYGESFATAMGPANGH
jgi:hypothetical protein